MLHPLVKCTNFVAGIPSNAYANQTVRFTSESVWQPFIKNTLHPKQPHAQLCGVLVEILREYSRKWNVSLTYVVYNDTDGVPYDSFRDDRIDLLLNPFPPMGWNFTRMSGTILPSRVVNDIAMLTMLSAIERPQTFNSSRFLTIFNVPFVYIYLASHLIVHSMFLFFFRKIYLKESVGSNLLRFTFRQTGNNFRRQQLTSTLLVNFLWLSIFFQFFVSNIFLDLATQPAPMKGIQTMEDLYNRSDVTAIVFKEETSHNMLMEMQESKLFTGKILSLNADDFANNAKNKTLELMKSIMTGKHVMVSDQYFLDYECSRYKSQFPRLSRPDMKRMTLPFFILGRHKFMKQNQPKLDFILQQLLESGILDMWLQEYLKNAGHLMRHKSEMIKTGSLAFKPLTIHDLKVSFELFLALSILSGVIFLGEICHFICKIQLDRHHQST